MSAELAGTASLRVHISARSILLLLGGKAVRHPVKSSTRDHSIHGRSTTTAMAINETETESSRAWLSAYIKVFSCPSVASAFSS
ncbi:hypothetical protein B0T09DRAFT_347876 [Sordaria sp. MPI-SDFR-AT-0083]|nr:hypothetical protein B0T09DRAFT_347876 [Sordaria sp. MPI-SDFR-AT-0083]